MSIDDPRIPVAVLGATGMVGQRFVALLEAHPWFRLAEVAASPRSAGRRYGDAVVWSAPGVVPGAAADLVVESVDDELPRRLVSRLVFSALDTDLAREHEPALARAGKLVVTNASALRMDPRVPLLVPEVNPEHLALSEAWDEGDGAVLANPNCSTIGLALVLAPLARAFGVELAHVVTLQALSGAGRPGVASLDALDNIVPFIPGEEEKLGVEPGKILGALVRERGRAAVARHPLVVSAQCNRVAVRDGHTLCVSVRLGKQAAREDLLRAWRDFRAPGVTGALPTAPDQPIVYDDAPNAPQPLLHRDTGRGMASVVGRLQPCPVLGWRFVTLTHNTLRGAAGGALLCAELAASLGWKGLEVPGTSHSQRRRSPSHGR